MFALELHLKDSIELAKGSREAAKCQDSSETESLATCLNFFDKRVMRLDNH